jgi:hypothetical protein
LNIAAEPFSGLARFPAFGDHKRFTATGFGHPFNQITIHAAANTK